MRIREREINYDTGRQVDRLTDREKERKQREKKKSEKTERE